MERDRGVWGTVVTYAVVLVVYVALGVLTGSLVLNWILGPLFPLLALHVIPRGARRVFRPAGADR